VLIEGNQVMLWSVGILAHGARDTVRRNQVSMNGVGMDIGGTSFAIGNVAADNGHGFDLADSSSAIGNGVYGNSSFGLFAVGLSGAISANNIFGNQSGGGNPAIPSRSSS
jgi:hypothetical protein